MAFIWPFPYDWSGGVSVSYTWLTQISRSDSGKEFRKVVRARPRWSLSASMLARTPLQTSQLSRLLSQYQGGELDVVDPLQPAVRKTVRLLDPTAANLLGAGVARSALSFSALPGIAPFAGATWSGQNYLGRPVMPWRFDWASDLGPLVGRETKLVDYDIGLSSLGVYSTHHTRRYEGAILLANKVSLDALVGLAHHLRGSAGILYLPAPEAIGVVMGVDTVGSDTQVRVSSRYASEEFLGDGVNKHIEVTQGGFVWRAQVQSVVQDASSSYLRLLGPQLSGYSSGVRAVARWLYAARLAEDTLTIALRTPEVGQATIAFVALKE
jgi:hypothetical protein